MASDPSAVSLADFPEDVQVTVLSFLSPAEVSFVACTSRHFASLCVQSKVWLAMCDRRWGSKTTIRSWASGGGCHYGGNFFSLLYKILDRWESLIGIWRHIGKRTAGAPRLVFFEWGPSFISGSRVSPSTESGSYNVLKVPFLWMGLSPRGEPVSFLQAGSEVAPAEDFLKPASEPGFSDLDLVPATVTLMGGNHFILEEKRLSYEDIRGCDEVGTVEEGMSVEGTSPPDFLMSEIYQYLANRTSPIGDKAIRRQRKKREKGRLWRMRYESEHFVKVVNCYPTPSQPLQGLWKGVCEDMKLDFFLVTYDDIGGINCRRVGDATEPFSGYSPIFWTSNTTFLESPFSKEEEDIYHSRQHIQPVEFSCTNVERVVSRILCINSCYDLVIPGSSVDPRNVEGRMWVYRGGTFGFGFLRNNYIVDLKHIALNGCLLDSIEYSCIGPSW